MALKHTRKNGRAAFTLVELLVVIGIMAVLATISVAGYSAASRGMADRGVIQTTVSILRIAQQTCGIDRVPTKVLFFNQRLSDGTDEGSTTRYQGTAIAIKQAGRITVNPSQVNGLLVDEFADWNQSYPLSNSGGAGTSQGMRFFRMKADDESQGLEDCSVLVQPSVMHRELTEYMIQSDTEMNTWCRTHKRTAGDNRPNDAPSSYVSIGNNEVCGFEINSRGSGGSLSWKVGDPYGVEIARIDLPKGYIFGSKEPKDDKLVSASIKEVHFDPDQDEPMMSRTVLVSAMRQTSGGMVSAKKVGDVTSSMLDDRSN